MINRKRILYLLLIIGVMVLGIGSRKFGIYLPVIVSKYAGDVLWALMIYLMIGFVWPRLAIKKIIIMGLIFCYGIECSQLYQASWINNIRDTTLGALVLGHGFLLSDLICYTIGCCLGALVEVSYYRKKGYPLILIAVTMGTILFCSWQNNSIVVTSIIYTNEKIPKEFEGYKILQVSDLHNKAFGDKQRPLLEKTIKADPDVIVITGDLIDSKRTDIGTAMEYINEAIKIAPIYYVSGNHEAWSGVYLELSAKLREAGVVILDDAKIEIKKSKQAITLMGMADPAFGSSNYLEEYRQYDKEAFKMLLSHRPELINLYVQNEVDLVFTGHAHGGQFRLPLIGGLIAPNQGLFPKYTSGIHKIDNTSMIVSRGLGNSIIPLRIFNRPELIVVTLKK